MDALKELIKFVRKARMPWFHILGNNIVSILAAGFGIAGACAVGAIIDYPLRYGDDLWMGRLVIAVVLIAAIYYLLMALADYVRATISSEIGRRCSRKAFASALSSPVVADQPFLPDRKASLIVEDLPSAAAFIAYLTTATISNSIVVVAIAAISMNIDWRFGVILALLVPISIFEVMARSDHGDELVAMKRGVALKGFALERMKNKLTIASCAQEERELESFAKQFDGYAISTGRCAAKNIAIDRLRGIAVIVWVAGVGWSFAIHRGLADITLGTMAAVFVMMLMAIPAVSSLMAVLNIFKDGMKRISSVNGLITSARDETEGLASNSWLGDCTNPVVGFDGLSIPPCSFTAIIAERENYLPIMRALVKNNIAGESSAVICDGELVYESRVAPIIGAGSIINYSSMLFDASIMDNVLYGNEGLNRGDAIEALAYVGARSLIENIHGQYDAPAGLGGSLLSPDERRRVALARLLLRDPSLIVISEDDGGVFGDSNCALDIALRQKGRRSVCVFARRLETIKAADAIIAFDGLKVAEMGGFDGLMMNRKELYRFYWRCFGSFATFRGQLDAEIARSTRYGSKFCFAALKLYSDDLNIDNISDSIRRKIRLGDNCSHLDDGIVLVLLPEIDDVGLQGFINRIERELKIERADCSMVGLHIKGGIAKSTEELLSDIKAYVERDGGRGVTSILDVKQLAEGLVSL